MSRLQACLHHCTLCALPRLPPATWTAPVFSWAKPPPLGHNPYLPSPAKQAGTCILLYQGCAAQGAPTLAPGRMLSRSFQAAAGNQRCSSSTSRTPGLLSISSSSRVRPRLCLVCGLKENVQQLAPIDDLQRVVVGGGPEPWVIANAPGKKASLAIYAHLAKKYNGQLTAAAAQEGLQLYGEYVEEAQQQPGSHPNIDLLLEVVASGNSRPLTVE